VNRPAISVKRSGDRVLLRVGPGVIELSEPEALALASELACACDDESDLARKHVRTAIDIGTSARQFMRSLGVMK
jgi:hypothetical protein